VISNVPAVLLFKPALVAAASQKLWLILALSSTFAGNLSIVGSIANIIVIEGASHEVKISFLDYAKSGVVVTILTLAVGLLWLWLVP